MAVEAQNEVEWFERKVVTGNDLAHQKPGKRPLLEPRVKWAPAKACRCIFNISNKRVPVFINYGHGEGCRSSYGIFTCINTGFCWRCCGLLPRLLALYYSEASREKPRVEGSQSRLSVCYTCPAFHLCWLIDIEEAIRDNIPPQGEAVSLQHVCSLPPSGLADSQHCAPGALLAFIFLGKASNSNLLFPAIFMFAFCV